MMPLVGNVRARAVEFDAIDVRSGKTTALRGTSSFLPPSLLAAQFFKRRGRQKSGT
jgi:hypothetical protein